MKQHEHLSIAKALNSAQSAASEQSGQHVAGYTYIQVLLISLPPFDISLYGALQSPEITIVLFPFFQNSKIKDVWSQPSFIWI